MTALRWSATMRIAGQVTSWALTLFVIRLLAPEDYGLMAMAMLVLAFLSLFNSAGVDTVLVQKQEVSGDEIACASGVMLVTNLTSLLVAVLCAPLLSEFFGAPDLALVVTVGSLWFVFQAFSIVPAALLTRRMDFRAKSIIDFISNLCGGIVSFTLALFDAGVWALVGGMLTTAAGQALGVNFVAWPGSLPRFSLARSRALIRVGGAVTVDRCAWFLYSRADVFLLGRAFGAEIVGLYEVATRLASLPAEKLNPLLNEIALPAFARISDKSDEVSRNLRLVLRVIGFAVMPIFFGMAAIAPEFVELLLGPRWEPVIGAFAILCIAMPLRILSSLLTSALQGVRRVYMAAVNQVLTLIVLLPGFLLAAQHGIEAMAVAWLVGYPIALAIEVTRSRRVTGIAVTTLGGILGRTAVVSVVMYAAVQAVRPFLATVELPGLALVALIGTGVATYGIASIVINRATYRFALSLCRDLLRVRR